MLTIHDLAFAAIPIVGVIVLEHQGRVDHADIAALEPVARPLAVLAAGKVRAELPRAP
jgi:hypothetical protein